MCKNTNGRLQEETSGFFLVVTTPTFLIVFLLVYHEQFWERRAELAITLICIWALLLLSTILTLRQTAWVGLTMASFLAFYVIASITYPSTYDIYVTGERIAYIDIPNLAIVGAIPSTTIILYFYFAIMLSFCHWITKCFPKKCEFFFPFEIVILLFVGVSIYELTELNSMQQQELQLVYILMTACIGLGQLLIIFTPSAFKHAISGLLDSFKWTYMSKLEGLVYVVYILLCLATSVYSFWAGNKTQFRGANNDDIPMLLVGLFFIIVLQMFSGLLGFLFSKIIRKIRGPVRRPQAAAHSPLHDHNIREDPKDWSKIELSQYDKEVQNNQQCPICIDEFPLGQEVAVHTDCKNGYHPVCIQEWVSSGKNTCPLCRNAIK